MVYQEIENDEMNEPPVANFYGGKSGGFNLVGHSEKIAET